jgi:hypothetical protein
MDAEYDTVDGEYDTVDGSPDKSCQQPPQGR